MTTTTANRRTLTSKNMVVTTELTDSQAIRILRNRTNQSNFCSDLINKWDTVEARRASGRHAYGLTEAQLAWVHKLANEELNKKNEPAVTVTTIGDLKAVMDLFTKVRQHVSRPKIRLNVPAKAGDTTTTRVVIALATSGKHPGTLNVTDGGSWGNNRWFGRITMDGNLIESRDCYPEIVMVLRRFAADPAGVAAEHGRLNGQCCFCGMALTDERSTQVGYGPVCGTHFSLPWGEERFVFDRTV